MSDFHLKNTINILTKAKHRRYNERSYIIIF